MEGTEVRSLAENADFQQHPKTTRWTFPVELSVKEAAVIQRVWSKVS